MLTRFLWGMCCLLRGRRSTFKPHTPSGSALDRYCTLHWCSDFCCTELVLPLTELFAAAFVLLLVVTLIRLNPHPHPLTHPPTQLEHGYDHNFCLFGLDQNAKFIVENGMASKL